MGKVILLWHEAARVKLFFTRIFQVPLSLCIKLRKIIFLFLVLFFGEIGTLLFLYWTLFDFIVFIVPFWGCSMIDTSVTCYSSKVTLLPNLQYNIIWLHDFLAPPEVSHWLSAFLSYDGEAKFLRSLSLASVLQCLHLETYGVSLGTWEWYLWEGYYFVGILGQLSLINGNEI